MQLPSDFASVRYEEAAKNLPDLERKVIHESYLHLDEYDRLRKWERIAVEQGYSKRYMLKLHRNVGKKILINS